MYFKVFEWPLFLLLSYFFLLYMHLRIAISVSKRSKNGVTHKVAARVKCKELRMIIEIVFWGRVVVRFFRPLLHVDQFCK